MENEICFNTWTVVCIIIIQLITIWSLVKNQFDRRKFLAFIPALSAIPIVGQNAEREKDKIIIYPEEALPKPEEQDVMVSAMKQALAGGDSFVVTVHHKGELFAIGHATNLELHYSGEPVRNMNFAWRTRPPFYDVGIEAKLRRVNDKPLSFEGGRCSVDLCEPGEVAYITMKF